MAYLQSAAIRRHWVAAGLVYGIAVCVPMTFVVLPLSAEVFPRSAIGHSATPIGDQVNGAIGHTITVGLASAHVPRRWLGTSISAAGVSTAEGQRTAGSGSTAIGVRCGDPCGHTSAWTGRAAAVRWRLAGPARPVRLGSGEPSRAPQVMRGR